MAAQHVETEQEQATLSTGLQSATEEPEEEEEGAVMTLVEHLEELRRRIIRSFIAVVVASIAGFFLWDRVLNLLTNPLPDIAAKLPHTHGGQKLITTDIGEPFLIALKLALAIGIVIASPYILYQIGAFFTPALTRKERKYAIPFALLGIGLFVIGIVVGYFVLRYPVDWLINFGNSQFDMLIKADSYLTFVAYFLLAFGITFELPLVLTFLGVVGIINSRMLRAKRMYILFGLWILSCFITPGTDPYSPVIVGVALTLLFEFSIILLRIIKR